MVIKDKKSQVKNGTVIVTKVVEEVLNENDLLQRKQQTQYQLASLRQQMQNLKAQYEALILECTELDTLLIAIQNENTELPTA